MYKYSDVTYKIISVAMEVHRSIGPGFQERIYHNAMNIALKKEGCNFESEKEFYVYFHKQRVGTFRVDLFVDKKVIVELKAVCGEMLPIFQTQTISYLKASNVEVGLLINFGNRGIDIKRLGRYKNFSV